MKVILKRVSKGGKPERVGEIKMVDGKMVSTPKWILERTTGVLNVLEKKYDQMLTPNDGIKFLKNLKFHFKNAYLWAEEKED